ncbi:MAG TPA: GAF domain-containing protein [Chloroflexi bacterium]|nr:GAF domain-containing protein [Chloroflexota bacterium]
MDSSAKLETLAAEFERLAEKGVRSAPEMGRLVAELEAEFAEMAQQRRELASLYDIARELTATQDLGDLLESIIDKAIVLVGAERGFVVLSRPEGGYYVAAARRFSAGEVAETDDAFSSSLIERVMARREPILTKNVQMDDRFELTQSIVVQNIRSVIAVPLVARSELLGAIYVDTRLGTRLFGEDELRLLEAMASQAAMAIRGAKLYDDMCRSNEQLRAALDQLRDAQTQLVQAERLAAVGRLAAGVAHELRNPLMVMRNSLYYLDRLLAMGKTDSPDVWRRYITKMDGEIDRQSKIINDLLFFSRNRPRTLTQVDLNALLREVLMRTPMAESIEVREELQSDLPELRVDADQLQQVFINLIVNAVQAMPEGGTLTVSTRSTEYHVIAEVADTGVGMSEEDLERLFQPFFTTKERGIGLGLSVSHSIIEAHRGKIAVSSEPGRGTRFTVELPLNLIG